MNDAQTYTAYIPADDLMKDDQVIARRLSSSEAMKIAFGYGDGWNVRLDEDNYGSFSLYTWWACPRKTAHPWSNHLQVTVARTAQPELDKLAAMDMIAAQFLRRQTVYWDGRVTTDDEFDKRQKHVAERREVQRVDREIATKIVDELLRDGYTITCDLQDVEPEFKRSTDRNGILDYMWQVEIVEMRVHRGKSAGWLRLIFGESGWDLVQDYTVDLEHIIDPICEPYLPWNQPNASELDHGVRMIELNSPDDVSKIADLLK